MKPSPHRFRRPERGGSRHSQTQSNGTPSNGQDELATNKQIQFLLSLGKRQRLSTANLEKKIAEILGRPVGVYDLMKQAAGVVIEALTDNSPNGSRAH